jgi:phosphohistidine phosphatase
MPDYSIKLHLIVLNLSYLNSEHLKQLLLIRHAKTEQVPLIKDIERKLTDRGHSDCELMGNRLLKQGFQPSKILVSSAQRTMQTAKNLKEFLHCKENQLEVLSKLYLASAEEMLDAIKKTEDKVDSLALIAHNPGMTDLFNMLGNVTLDNLPTCGMALFEFDIDSWKRIKNHENILLWYSWPKGN